MGDGFIEIADNVLDRFNAIGEKLKVGGAEVGRKVSARMTSVGGKVKELFQVPTPADKIVEEATAATLGTPDWGKNLEICDMVNAEKVSGQEVVRAIKKRLMNKDAGVQLLTLTLLEVCLKNCEKMFSEVASERVLDEMVKLVDDPQTWSRTRDKALHLIEAWGESVDELRYLPVFELTYQSLRSRGVRFPARDRESLAPIFTPPRSVVMPPAETNRPLVSSPIPAGNAKELFSLAQNSAELLSTVLTSSPTQEVLQEELTITLAAQCRQYQFAIQRLVQNAGDNDAILFEALTVNDTLGKVLSELQEASKVLQETTASSGVQLEEPALVTAQVIGENGSTQNHSLS